MDHVTSGRLQELREKYKLPSKMSWKAVLFDPQFLARILLPLAIFYFVPPFILSLEILPSWIDTFVLILFLCAAFYIVDGLIYLGKRLLRRA